MVSRRLISVQSSNPTTGSSRPTSPAPKPTSSPIAKPKLSPDEAIKAEEDALKKLEASILPLRQMTTRKPSQSPSLRSPTPPTTEHSTADQATYTPAKTPIPHVTNSLVNGTTPHRAAPATSNRFSPLRFLGTPRAPTGQPSGLRSVVRDGDDAGERRPIFARGGLGRSTSSSNARPPISEVTAVPADDDEPGDDDDAEEGGREEDTVRLHVPSSIAETGAEERAIVPPSPERTGDEEDATVHEAETVPQSSPARVMAPGSPEMKGPKKVEGVKIELESVKAALVSPSCVQERSLTTASAGEDLEHYE